MSSTTGTEGEGGARTGRVAAVLRLAVPSAGELLLSMLVGLVNTYLVGHLGAASLTAVGLSSQWAMVGSVLFSAVGTGATALVARLVGAREWPEVSRVLGQALLVAMAMGVLAVVVLELTAGSALRLMGAEAEALAQGVPYLRAVSSVYVLIAVMFIGNACLRGAGDTRTPMLVMGAVNLVNLTLSWSLINGVAGLPRLGVMGAAAGEVGARVVGAALVLWILVRGRAGMTLHLSLLRPDPALIRRILRIGLPAGVEQLVFRLGMLLFVRVVAALGTVAFAAHQVALNSESLSFMPGFGFAVAATPLV
ncbi:MAG: MATE family efflux transporter, partial [Candidatus Latescibacterota bacterium]